MSDDEKVKRLPIKFKAPPGEEDPMLRVVHYDGGCDHKWGHRGDAMSPGGSKIVSATYLIREGEMEVECGLCKTRLDPMFVLRVLANEESKWMATRKRYQEEMKRLAERERTTCDHCGKMTRISRR